MHHPHPHPQKKGVCKCSDNTGCHVAYVKPSIQVQQKATYLKNVLIFQQQWEQCQRQHTWTFFWEQTFLNASEWFCGVNACLCPYNLKKTKSFGFSRAQFTIFSFVPAPALSDFLRLPSILGSTFEPRFLSLTWEFRFPLRTSLLKDQAGLSILAVFLWQIAFPRRKECASIICQSMWSFCFEVGAGLAYSSTWSFQDSWFLWLPVFLSSISTSTECMTVGNSGLKLLCMGLPALALS